MPKIKLSRLNSFYRYLLKVFQKQKFFLIIILLVTSLILSSLIIFPQGLRSAFASGNTYIVDGSATTNGVGTLTSPFNTIQACSNIARAGDTCQIRGGIYREEVRPANSGTSSSPITYTNYNNEKVIITGLTEIKENQNGAGTWQQHNSNIWKIQLPSSLDLGRNQVFINDIIQMDARWPNMPNSNEFLKREDYAISQAGSLVSSSGTTRTGRYTHPQMPNWANGAKMSFTPGMEWWGFIGEVRAQNGTQIDFTYTAEDQWIRFATPASDDPFMLWDKLEALDIEKEFFIDKTGSYGPINTLYIFGNPSGKKIEIKTRERILNLEDRQNIKISNLEFRVGAISTNDNSANIILDNIESKFGAYNMWTGWNRPAILLRGNNNQLINSNIAFTGSDFLQARGNNLIIKNNTFAYSGYNIQASDGIQTQNLFDSIIENNTVFATNQIAISFAGLKRGKVNNNHVFGIGYQVTDTAAINTWNGGDGQGTEIAYNLVHDVIAYNNPIGQHNGGAGIRIDSGQSTIGNCNLNIHHNIIFRTTEPGIAVWGMTNSQFQNCNPTNFANRDTNNNIYNNTIDGYLLSDFDDLSGTEVKNNFITGKWKGKTTGVDAQANTFDVSDINFIDKANQDYRLRPTSEGLDTGIQLPPFTNGYLGSNPDRGALEDGKKPFVTGAVISEKDLNNLNITCNTLNSTCSLTNLPSGRKLPEDFKILFAGQDILKACIHKVENLITGQISANCSINNTNLTNSQNLALQIGSTIVNKGNFNLSNKVLINNLNPNKGEFSGGNTVTINGQNFQNSNTNIYSRNIEISNTSAQTLFDYQVPITIDTSSLISQGKLKNDCSNLRFEDNYGQLNYWLDSKQCNQSQSIVWVRVPKLNRGTNQIKVSYGDPTWQSLSSCQKTFYFCDEFEDGNIPNIYDLTTASGISVVEQNGEMRISGNNDSLRFQMQGFRVNWRLALPSSGNYSFDSDVRLANLGGSTSWKAGFGGFDNNIALYNGGRMVGGYNGSTLETYGSATLSTNSNNWQTFGTAFNDSADRIHLLLNNNLIGTRNNYTTSMDHRWAFAPQINGANWDIRVDNLRIRNFSPDAIEPRVTNISQEIQNSPLSITINSQPCIDLTYISSTQLTCKVPAYTGSQTNSILVDVKVTNPNGETFTLTNGYTYENQNNNIVGDYYVDFTNGKDTNDGKTPNSAWKTIGKVNASMNLFKPGNKILFKCGEVWNGESLDIQVSGTNSEKIIFGSYPTSNCTNKPVISGSIGISGWQNYTTNIYVADLSSGANSGKFPNGINQLFSGTVRKPFGRWPNLNDSNFPDGYSRIDAAPNLKQIIDNQLPNENWTGANIHIKGMRWYIFNRQVTASSGTTLTLNADTACYGGCASNGGWGFWLSNHLKTLDSEGEWYWDQATNKLYYYTTLGKPNDNALQGSTILKTDNRIWGGINLGRDFSNPANYITIDNLQIENWYANGIAIPQNFSGTDPDSITIQNTIVLNSNQSSLSLHSWVFSANDNLPDGWRGGKNLIIKDNIFDSSNSTGVLFSARNSTFIGNQILNTGLIKNLTAIGLGCGFTGGDGQCTGQGAGIRLIHHNNTLNGNNNITLNILDNIGDNGIHIFSTNNTISKNLIKNIGQTLGDVGGIRASANSVTNANIQENIIINVLGDTKGTNQTYKDLFGFGIKAELGATGFNIINNTIINSTANGIHFRGDTGGKIIGNTVYKNGIFEVASNQIAIENGNGNILEISNNKIYGIANTFDNNKVLDIGNTSRVGNIDNNYYMQPYNNRYIGANGNNYNLAGWQALSNKDLNSKAIWFTLNKNESDLSEIFYNDTNQVKTINLNQNYLNLDRQPINNSITLQPFSSQILIKDNSTPTCSLVVTNINDSGQGSLRNAINCAQNGDTITFDSSINGQTIKLNSELIVNKNLIIDGQDKNIKIDGQNQTRIFKIEQNNGQGVTFEIKNLTLQKAKVTGIGENAAGGAIWTASRTTLKVDNLKFLDNYAQGEGGGAIFAGYKSDNTILNSLFEKNSTDGDDGTSIGTERGGGAIAVKSDSNTRVENSTFKENIGTNGGAINTLLGGLIIKNSNFIENSSLKNNRQGYGGAIYTDGASRTTDNTTTGTILIEGSRFENNIGRGQGGGLFLFVYNGDTIIVKDSVIIRNKVLKALNNNDSLGGGIRFGNGIINIENVLFVNNEALAQGGGAWIGGSQTNSVTLNKVTFLENKAIENNTNGLGGAITFSLNTPVNINQSSFIRNLAGFQGGAFWGGGSNVRISNSIFDSNEGNNPWNVKEQTGEQMQDGGNNYEWPQITVSNQVFPVTNGNIFRNPQFSNWIDSLNAIVNHPCHNNNQIPTNAGSGGLCANQNSSSSSSSSSSTSNQAPSLSIINPNNNQEFNVNQTINIQVNASDPDGSITKIEFYLNNNKIYEDRNNLNSWSYQLNNLNIGNYQLSIKVFDNQNQETNQTINFIVKANNNSSSSSSQIIQCQGIGCGLPNTKYSFNPQSTTVARQTEDITLSIQAGVISQPRGGTQVCLLRAKYPNASANDSQKGYNYVTTNILSTTSMSNAQIVQIDNQSYIQIPYNNTNGGCSFTNVYKKEKQDLIHVLDYNIQVVERDSNGNIVNQYFADPSHVLLYGAFATTIASTCNADPDDPNYQTIVNSLRALGETVIDCPADGVY